MLADDYDTSHHDSVNARLPNPFVCSRDSQRDAEEQFSKMLKKMMQKEKDTVNLNPDIEAYAVQRQGGYQRTNDARLGNQAPGMSRPQYPGGYGPAADRQAFEQQQQAYRPQYQYVSVPKSATAAATLSERLPATGTVPRSETYCAGRHQSAHLATYIATTPWWWRGINDKW